MGPDCGTAYLGGVGLGFANVVPRGRVGCVAASGTGLQAVVSRLAALGEGISHGIGVGGRDLSAEVGGTMTRLALGALARDARTEAIVVISKPPSAGVLPALEAAIGSAGKPVVVCCLGASARPGAPGTWVSTLDDAADAVVALLHQRPWAPRAFSDPGSVRARVAALGPVRGTVLGLYTGGTLAHEARLLLEPVLGDGQRILDLGADEFTVGRPHPMLDPDARAVRVREAARDGDVACCCSTWCSGGARTPIRPPRWPVRFAMRARPLSAAGARCSPWRRSSAPRPIRSALSAQVDQLRAAGVEILPSNAEAARFAALAVRPDRGVFTAGGAMTLDDGLDQPLRVINVGLELFAEQVEAQAATVLHVDWRPPAGGADIASLLAQLEDEA